MGTVGAAVQRHTLAPADLARPAVKRIAIGNPASVLVGDFLYSRSFQMMVGLDNMRVMQILSDATNVIAEGEVLQLMNCHDADVDVANYMRVIHCKTAKLFEAAMRLGAMHVADHSADADAEADPISLPSIPS